MTNNLRKIRQDLCAYIKRCKDVHYSDSLLIIFLMSGIIFARNNLFSAPADPVEAQKTEITNSIHSIRQQFRQARSENNKLLKATNLELTKLMEQGDHVTKSPWSSWQFGINYFNNNWNGTYKGRGDKKEKYPYEGVLKRDTTEFNRYVSPDSLMYSKLPVSTDPQSASSNSRAGLTNYGLASNTTVPEPPVSFQITASIKPRIVNKSAINVPAPEALTPTLPEAIDFNPADPQISAPKAPKVEIPAIAPPNTGNGDEVYIRSEGGSGTGTLVVDNGGNYYVGVISQMSVDGNGSTMTVMGKSAGTDTTSGTTRHTGSFDISTDSKVNFTGHRGFNHTSTATYNNSLNLQNIIYKVELVTESTFGKLFLQDWQKSI